MFRVAYTVEEAAKMMGDLNKRDIWDAIRDRRLIARSERGVLLITHVDLVEFANHIPEYQD